MDSHTCTTRLEDRDAIFQKLGQGHFGGYVKYINKFVYYMNVFFHIKDKKSNKKSVFGMCPTQRK